MVTRRLDAVGPSVERRERLRAVIALGANRRIAAAAIGVTERTLRRWLKRGRDGDEPAYQALYADVVEAEAAAGQHALKCLYDNIAKGDWRAASWWLERRWPEDWGSNRSEIKRLLEELVSAQRQRQQRREAGERLAEWGLDGPAASSG